MLGTNTAPNINSIYLLSTRLLHVAKKIF